MPRKAEPRRKTVTRYLDPHGCQVPRGTPGARRVVTQTDTYYFRGRSLETTDLSTAWAKVREILRRDREQELGIRTEQTDHLARPIGEHVAAWLDDLTAEGATGPKELGEARSHVTKVIGWARWARLGDVTLSTCLGALNHLQSKLGRSAQTRNNYQRHVRQFLSWCVRTRRLPTDPLAGMAPVSTETDRRHDRRCPEDAEIGLLMGHLEGERARVRQGMTGRQRALGYRLCMATGLRAGELRSLTPRSFDLDRAEVTVPAAYSKRRRRDTLPLPPWLVAELRTWFEAGGECWSGFPATFPGRLLKADLVAARAEWIESATDDGSRQLRERSPWLAWSAPGPDGSPLFFDFHSLRHWYITWIANQPGISPKTLLELARHSTPELTLRVYAKARRDDLRRAVESLPPPDSSC